MDAMPRAKKGDLVELFGFAPDDLSAPANKQWSSKECPFSAKRCDKKSHPLPDGACDIYGSCSATQGKGDAIICPKRMYGGNHLALRTVAQDAFGSDIPFYTRLEYEKMLSNGNNPGRCVVARPETRVSFPESTSYVSLDWGMFLIEDDGTCQHMATVEFQSMDITDNYRDTWKAYRDLKSGKTITVIPESAHGLNELNVHKRLSQQIIRKGNTIKTSKVCSKGLYFVITEEAFAVFEKTLRSLDPVAGPSPDTLTVMRVKLGPAVSHGNIRSVQMVDEVIRVSLSKFALSLISEGAAPPGTALDNAAQKVVQDMLKKYRPLLKGI
jgi:hypothetical protein